MDFKLTKKQQKVIDGEDHWDLTITKNEDGSISVSRGLIPYEEFHEILNYLFQNGNGKMQMVSGKQEDFIFVRKKLKIKVV